MPLPLEEYGVDAERPDPPHRRQDRRDADGGGLALVAKGEPRGADRRPRRPAERAGLGGARSAATAALGCRHYSLFDFRIDPDGRPWFLEAGLYCSFARQSVIATMAEASGLPLRDQFALALREASSPRSPA